MPKLFVTYVRKDDESNITVFKKGDDKPYVAHFTHPNWDLIVEKSLADDESVLDLFDIAGTIRDRFEPLSDRVSVYNGEVFFDGDQMHGSIVDHIVRFLREGRTDWLPLVTFYENLQMNPSQRSRERLYAWLDTHKFGITDDGMIVGYKGVHTIKAAKDAFLGRYQSDNQGDAIVDGVWHRNARIPNDPGTIVNMPRSLVRDDPGQPCAVGLHVANFGFAKTFAAGNDHATLEIHVHPRDVVSIPNDASDAKMRVCKYLVVGPVDKPWERALVAPAPRDVDLADDEDDEEDELIDAPEADPTAQPQAAPAQAAPQTTPELTAAEAKKLPEPRDFQWDALVSRSKRRRQSIVSLALRQGWLPVAGGDPKERTGWRVP